MRKFKNILIIFLRILLVFLLIDNLSRIMDVYYWESYDSEKWLEYGLKSIFTHTENSGKMFDFVKFLSTLSVYFALDIYSIINITNISLGFREVIKYHSRNKIDYIKNVIKVSFRLNWRDIFYWLLAFIIPIILFKGKISDLGYMEIIFIITNYIYNNFIGLVSTNPLVSIILFTLKYLIFSIFIGYELLLIILIIVIVFILYNVKEGDNL